ncbi:GNAT family N-acetyltransferase, partial [bacterium]|nr:GNAT family N-acetyltransferase [bacterium]
CIGAFDIEPAPVASAKIGYWLIQPAPVVAKAGYWLNQLETGREILTDALKALESELFVRGFNRLEIQVEGGSSLSMQVPARAGYHLDGILRDAVYLYGCPWDLHIYSKLVAESEQHV